ncbi:unnamed protein product [Rotaria magnacalcarata]|uniref:Uncharacterized protein n=1 Tax=Rotaria magnacalcarata TaxID=392030 RepID=A0A816VYC9_9BILA|nr:unnamed protein product [Rotaria magnacalcarata]CAF1613348.1 unnamed protein product [Rotaria magnacalcarata]CAF2126693.1 unnamed protein product [Rotaria magnacalcarata]CAF3912909.1 unnamed protein product [Rotaria magnacalcarata]CAF3913715.1 unnamed protein product [Rotaria magnacalcarata]
MNINQLRNDLEANYNFSSYQSFLSLRWFLFEPEYVQIELDMNTIDQSSENTVQMLNGDLLYTFNRVIEPTIDTSRMILYIKFPAYEHSNSQIRYPYHFQSFGNNAMQYILKQLISLPTEFISWSEKSMYI